MYTSFLTSDITSVYIHFILQTLVYNFQALTLCKKGCYTHLYNIVIQVVIQYLLYTLRIIVYNCV